LFSSDTGLLLAQSVFSHFLGNASCGFCIFFLFSYPCGLFSFGLLFCNAGSFSGIGLFLGNTSSLLCLGFFLGKSCCLCGFSFLLSDTSFF
jgi:hypothetical protein